MNILDASNGNTSGDNIDIDNVNPCQQIRSTCFTFYEYQCHITKKYNIIAPVTINHDAIHQVANDMLLQQNNHTIIPEWDEENWHYNLLLKKYNNNNNEEDNISMIQNWSYEVQYERTALCMLALDAINFCFWNEDNKDDNNDDTNIIGYEYEDLAQSLKYMASMDHIKQNETPNILSLSTFIFSPKSLANITYEQMKHLFEMAYEHIHKDNTNKKKTLFIPHIQKRVDMWNHIGIVLINEFDSSISNMMNRIKNKSATQFVHLLITYFPKCFGGDYSTIKRINDNDINIPNWDINISSNTKSNSTNDIADDTASSSDIMTIYFYKRAQICVGDMNSLLSLHLFNMNELTMFADYRVPQILYHYNIIQYSNELLNIINNQNIIPIHHFYEIAIRSATVTAVEILCQQLNNIQQQQNKQQNNNHNKEQQQPHLQQSKNVIDSNHISIDTIIKNDDVDDNSNNNNDYHSPKWTPVLTDWYLWKLGEKMMYENKLKPHHRVITIYY